MNEKRKQPKNQTPKKRAIKLSETTMSRKEIEELMGINRDTYIRKNGAVRRKGNG